MPSTSAWVIARNVHGAILNYGLFTSATCVAGRYGCWTECGVCLLRWVIMYVV